MKEFDIEERVRLAVQNFESGYNCAQSVFLAYSDVFELNLDMAKKMSVSFGGGVGRMREVCGTVSAMAMLAGFKYPVLDQSDQEARTKNYGMVQKMSELFKAEHETNHLSQSFTCCGSQSDHSCSFCKNSRILCQASLQ